MPQTHTNALLLIGGQSRRMGTDKANLEVDGKTLLQRTTDLLEPLVSQIHLSVAHDDQRPFDLPTLPDLSPNPGPLGGLEAAFQHNPDTPWLVLACDLPLLDHQTLETLLQSANGQTTAFASRLDGRAEPLCALYQPTAVPPLSEFLAADQRCARKFLESLTPQLLTLPNPLALDNANRPEHLTELQLLSQNGLVEKFPTITYYGKLSSEVPAPTEQITTTAATLAGLYEQVRLQHNLSLDLDTVKPVLADEFVSWNTLLPPDADVAFLPPFAGG
ncbi:MAG: NTP transferase domain-containing protein [Verrucomicrobiota bacterium]